MVAFLRIPVLSVCPLDSWTVGAVAPFREASKEWALALPFTTNQLRDALPVRDLDRVRVQAFLDDTPHSFIGQKQIERMGFERLVDTQPDNPLDSLLESSSYKENGKRFKRSESDIRDEYFERTLGPYLDLTRSVELIDRYMGEGLVEESSASYWLLGKLLKRGLKVTIHTVLALGEDKALSMGERIESGKKALQKALAPLFRNAIDPQISVQCYKPVFPKSELKFPHDRLAKLSLDNSFICLALGQGADTFKASKIPEGFGELTSLASIYPASPDDFSFLLSRGVQEKLHTLTLHIQRGEHGLMESVWTRVRHFGQAGSR